MSSPQCSPPALHDGPDTRPSVSALVKSTIGFPLMTLSPVCFCFSAKSLPLCGSMAPAHHWQLGASRNPDWNSDKHHPANDFLSLVIHRTCGKASTFLVQPPVECIAFLPLWFLHKGFCMQEKLEIQKASVFSQPDCLATHWGQVHLFYVTSLVPQTCFGISMVL